ncbi:hypothetical protein ACWN97_09960 [Pediococcus acidilactici]|uniref:hypothetical protein n=1 Tax=Pediococcus acidilactici TaxID=1254 RepID=UPI0013E3BDB8|nr:hypothetical protein [Pediococcus acidilactici]QOP72877.1 hypothetical protein ID874_05985 [Pediococcus acidilactici]QOP74167.1 hypothetical protein ID874_03305 [Pediococcus acidilactici]
MDWETEMQRLQDEQAKLMKKFERVLRNINRHDDDFAKELRQITEKLISNNVEINAMYR